MTHKQAVEKATEEYKKYKERTLSGVEQDYLNSIKILGKKQTMVKEMGNEQGSLSQIRFGGFFLTL